MLNDDNAEYVRDRASREYMLYNATIEDYLGFIEDQIKDPFDASIGMNYIKKIRKLCPDDSKMDNYCLRIIDMISDAYPNMEIDLDRIESHYLDFTEALYKFFTKNIRKLVTVFMKEYIFNVKNRKSIVQDYQDVKLANYPKEQYGKKENYILITFIKKIVKSYTKEGECTIQDFISYIKRADDCPSYVIDIEEYMEDGTIIDYGLFSDIMNYFWKSDVRDSMINKLSLKINEAIVQPCLKELGYDTFPMALIAQDDDDDLQDLDKTTDPDMGEDPNDQLPEYVDNPS